MKEEDIRKRAKEIFKKLIDVPVDLRSGTLQELCGTDAEVQHEVQELLAFHDRENHQLDGGVAHLVNAMGSPNDRTQQRVGAYQLEKIIARGGMSTVYLAKRIDGLFDQEVAIKFLKRDMVTPELVQRFHRERQLLADLQSPDIAQIMDGGISQDGTPYLVMEYVKGMTLNRFVHSKNASLQERLNLFQAVCQAVSYAHGKLIIHCDLKPDNILVTETAGKPNLKLLDFGVAKMLHDHVNSQSAQTTILGTRPFTPAYASPEQVRYEQLTVSTDVYSLGVLLYELLTGETPLRFVSKTPTEIEKVICSETPLLPSEIVKQSKTPIGDEPGVRSRQLTGDLDFIIMKALRKEPARRYASVTQLEEDLHRFQNNQPVLARPDSRKYRLGKYVKRHKLELAVAVIVFLALTAGLTAATLGLVRARDAEKQALVAQKEATNEANKAKTINAFLQEIISSSDPFVVAGKEMTISEALSRAESEVSSTFSGQPEIEASIRESMADSYYSMGRYDLAEIQLNQVLTVRASLKHDSMEKNLSILKMARVKRALGHYDQAKELTVPAIEALKLELGDTHERVLRSKCEFALLLKDQGNYEQAEEMAHQTLIHQENTFGQQHDDTLATMNALALAISGQERHGEAEVILKRRMSIIELKHQKNPLELMLAKSNIAYELMRQGKYEDAEILFRETFKTCSDLLGERHDYTLKSMDNLAQSLAYSNRFEEAEPFYRRALALKKEVMGPNHPEVFISMNNLGMLLQSHGQLKKARTLLEATLAGRTRILGESHEHTILTGFNLVVILFKQENFADCLLLIQRTVTLGERELSPDNWLLALYRQFLGHTLLKLGQTENAKPHLKQAHQDLSRILGSEHPRTQNCKTILNSM